MKKLLFVLMLLCFLMIPLVKAQTVNVGALVSIECVRDAEIEIGKMLDQPNISKADRDMYWDIWDQLIHIEIQLIIIRDYGYNPFFKGESK